MISRLFMKGQFDLFMTCAYIIYNIDSSSHKNRDVEVECIPFFFFKMDKRIASLNQKGIQAALSGDNSFAQKCFLDALSISLYSLESICNLLKLYCMQKQYSDGIDLFLRIESRTSLADEEPARCGAAVGRTQARSVH